MLKQVQEFLNKLDNEYGKRMSGKPSVTIIQGVVNLKLPFHTKDPFNGIVTIDFSEDEMDLPADTLFDSVKKCLDHDTLCATVAKMLSSFCVHRSSTNNMGHYVAQNYVLTDVTDDLNQSDKMLEVFQRILASDKPLNCMDGRLEDVFGAEYKRILSVDFVKGDILVSMRDLDEEELK